MGAKTGFVWAASLRAVFTHQMRVRWSELDPYNHLNHAAYLTYCETARVVMLEEAGFSMGRMTEDGFQIVVTEVHGRFLKPALDGQRLTVTTELQSARRASATWHQVISHEDDVLFDLVVTGAFTNLDGRPTRAPTGFIEAVSAR